MFDEGCEDRRPYSTSLDIISLLSSTGSEAIIKLPMSKAVWATLKDECSGVGKDANCCSSEVGPLGYPPVGASSATGDIYLASVGVVRALTGLF